MKIKSDLFTIRIRVSCPLRPIGVRGPPKSLIQLALFASQCSLTPAIYFGLTQRERHNEELIQNSRISPTNRTQRSRRVVTNLCQFRTLIAHFVAEQQQKQKPQRRTVSVSKEFLKIRNASANFHLMYRSHFCVQEKHMPIWHDLAW